MHPLPAAPAQGLILRQFMVLGPADVCPSFQAGCKQLLTLNLVLLCVTLRLATYDSDFVGVKGVEIKEKKRKDWGLAGNPPFWGVVPNLLCQTLPFWGVGNCKKKKKAHPIHRGCAMRPIHSVVRKFGRFQRPRSPHRSRVSTELPVDQVHAGFADSSTDLCALGCASAGQFS